MNSRILACLLVQLSAATAFAQITADAPTVRPDAIVDLACAMCRDCGCVAEVV